MLEHKISYTIDEAAQILRITPDHIMLLLLKGKLKGAQFNNVWRISRHDLAVFYRQCGGTSLFGDITCSPELSWQSNPNVSVHETAEISPSAEILTNLGGTICIGEGVCIRSHAILMTWGGSISIGKLSTVNPYCVLYGHGGLIIGERVQIATQTVFIPANHGFKLGEPIYYQPETRKGITVESDIWFGAGCKILDGVKIQSGAVIGAGSVVTKNIPENAVAVGVPARIIKYRE